MLEQIKRKKSYLILAGFFGVSLITILLGIGYAFLTEGDQPPTSATPTAAPVPSETTTEIEPVTETAIDYNAGDEEKLLEIIQTRPALSEEDKIAKAKILSFLPEGEVSGYVYNSSSMNIDYVRSANVFQVEILTKNFTQAKNEANIWFLLQGMSQDGICKAPVVFYLSYDIAEELRGTNTVFSTLPPGC